MGKASAPVRAVVEQHAEAASPLVWAEPAPLSSNFTVTQADAGSPRAQLPLLWRAAIILGLSALLWLMIAWLATLLV